MHKVPELVILGKSIRRLRESKGYSQDGFAFEISMDRAYYGGIERGERNVAAVNLIRIARALRVPVGELFPLELVEVHDPAYPGISKSNKS